MERHVFINSSYSDPIAEKQMLFEGSDVTVRLSPTDIPRSLSCVFDKKSNRLVITFDYPDTEQASVDQKEGAGVVIREGKYSGKLLRIYVSYPEQAGQPPASTFREKLLSALASRRKRFEGMKTISKELNQAVAEKVLLDDKVSIELLSAADSSF